MNVKIIAFKKLKNVLRKRGNPKISLLHMRPVIKFHKNQNGIPFAQNIPGMNRGVFFN